MSRHHNTKHPERGRSRYPERLARRGHSKTPQMESLDHLRDTQNARVRRQGYPFPSDYTDAQEAAE
jgi:hypothetical protein